jgi:hypothetical protein
VSRLADLKRQHEEWLRRGYDGHNRKSRRADTGDLRKRARRRRKNRQLTALADDWQSLRRAARRG